MDTGAIELACQLVESGVMSAREARAIVGLPERRRLWEPFLFPGHVAGPGARWRVTVTRITMPELLVELGAARGIAPRPQESEWSFRACLEDALGSDVVMDWICTHPGMLDFGSSDESNIRDFGFPYVVLPMPLTGRVGLLPWR